jgi:hypothetical protein
MSTPPTDPKLDSKRKPENDYRFPRAQNFEVVMLRNGVHSWEAKPDDYKRVPITAESTAAATRAQEVIEDKDFTFVKVAAPGHRSEEELEAQRRASERPPVDKTKI